MGEYDPQAYWNDLLSGKLTLAKVGQADLGAYNLVAYRLRLAALKRVLADVFPQWPNVRIFEAGFGVGFYLDYYAWAGVTQVTGIDLSAAAVMHTQALFPNYHLFQHDLTKSLPLPSESFDLVTAIDVLYHIVDDDHWYRALDNLCSLVAPGGVLVLTDKFPSSRIYQKFPHVRRRPLGMYTEALLDRGLLVQRVFPVFVFMDDPITCGEPRWLGHLSFAQWRVVQKMIRLLGPWPRLRDLLALGLAVIQYPAEKAALAVLKRSPNTEMLVARKEEI